LYFCDSKLYNLLKLCSFSLPFSPAKRIVSPETGVSVHFVFLDTNSMIPDYQPGGAYSHLDRMLSQPDGLSTQWERVEEQLDFLETSLTFSQDADFRIVVGHHPVFSKTYKGEESHSFLRGLFIFI
jgi:hypothetical protein